jgi:hypothetical protein
MSVLADQVDCRHAEQPADLALLPPCRLEELQAQLAEEVAALAAAALGPLRALGAWASVYESMAASEEMVGACAAAITEAQVGELAAGTPGATV